MTWEIRQGDALDRLREMPDESVHCCVTSPPYWGLRDYGVDGQLGLEETPEQFVAAMVEVFAEVRRVLRADGTLWLNIGDSYWTAKGTPGGEQAWRDGSNADAKNPARRFGKRPQDGPAPAGSGIKPKDLVGIPWMLAFALRADGWYLRSEIIWHKPNPMPESVTDRPTKSHEQIFLLAKSSPYFYDATAIREPDKGLDHPRQVLSGQPSLDPSGGASAPHRGLRTPEGRDGLGRNKRSVWTISTKPYPGAHFATFPPDLIEPCILAGSPKTACGECGSPWPDLRCGHDEPGAATVLDPFCGAATTGLVALRHERSFIGIELNPDYVELGRNRIRDDAPLLNVPAELEAA